MRKLLKYTSLLFFLPLWYLQKLLPRKGHIWVFGSWNGQRYSDNSKYLFDYVNTNHPKVRAIWLTKSQVVHEKLVNQGFECHKNWSTKGILLSLKAKYIFVSSGKKDINYLFINGAKLVHLWHGNPLKKIGLDDKYSSVNGFYYSKIVKHVFPMSFEFNYDYMVSNSEIFTPLMQSSYDLARNQILETGCPRNDVFFSQRKDGFNINLEKLYPGVKIIYYLPTFRSGDTPMNIFTQSDFDQKRVEEFLESENMILVSKGHFVEMDIETFDQKEKSRIIHLSDANIESDINNMLKDADALITDYSSVFFDFLLTQRPIIFAAFDLEEYMEKSRELYFDYEEAVAGPIARDWNEILYQLKNIWNNRENESLLKQKNRIYNKYHDSANSKRVAEAIISLS